MGLLDRFFGRTPAPVEPAPHGGDTCCGGCGGTPRVDDGLVAVLTGDHRDCDTDWVAVETAGNGDIDGVKAAFARFRDHVERHLAFEEQVLFPALQAAGMPPLGPIAVMIADHGDMRGLLAAMSDAADAGDVDRLLDQGDTLLVMTQQHNEKEEQILYRMAADLVGDRWEELGFARWQR